jgi:hypothetical protein
VQDKFTAKIKKFIDNAF